MSPTVLNESSGPTCDSTWPRMQPHAPRLQPHTPSTDRRTGVLTAHSPRPGTPRAARIELA
eukprot:scaffold7781_cov57-Phaeocystis_antarctica.AAC.4